VEDVEVVDVAELEAEVVEVDVTQGHAVDPAEVDDDFSVDEDPHVVALEGEGLAADVWNCVWIPVVKCVRGARDQAWCIVCIWR